MEGVTELKIYLTFNRAMETRNAHESNENIYEVPGPQQPCNNFAAIAQNFSDSGVRDSNFDRESLRRHRLHAEQQRRRNCEDKREGIFETGQRGDQEIGRD